MAQEETTKDLISFNWEGEEEDFFGIQSEGSVQVTPKKEEEEKPTDTPEEVEEEEEEGEVDDFFDLPKEGDTPLSGSEKENKPATNSDGYWNDIYNDFKSTGLLKHVEVEEGEVLTEDRLTELQEEDYEAEVSQRLVSWATEDLDEDAKAFIKFKRDGGSTADFLKTYGDASSIPKGKISDETYQDEIIRYNLKKEGWDKDEVEDRLQYLTENGRKEKVAKKYDEKTRANEEAEKASLTVRAEENRKAQRKNEELFKSSIQSVLETKKDIGGFKIKDTDKTDILNFLTKKSLKVDDTKSITPFQQKLAEVFKDSEKTVLLAKLLQNDFDMTELKKQISTSKTREIKSNLEQRRNLRPNNFGSSLKGTSLADIF